jgi:hypothetical protein
MSGPFHPTGRAIVSPRKPDALGVCDRCGFSYNLKNLRWQYQWQGLQLQNLRILVCRTCLDVPQIQLKTIILPPDPLPVLNPRPEPYDAEVPSYISEQDGTHLVTMDGVNLVTIREVTPSPDPDNPYLVPPDF